MNMSNLLEDIEQLREKLERCGRAAPLNSRELLQISDQLDRLINVYLNEKRDSGMPARPRGAWSGLRSGRREYEK